MRTAINKPLGYEANAIARPGRFAQHGGMTMAPSLYKKCVNIRILVPIDLCYPSLLLRYCIISTPTRC